MDFNRTPSNAIPINLTINGKEMDSKRWNGRNEGHDELFGGFSLEEHDDHWDNDGDGNTFALSVSPDKKEAKKKQAKDKKIEEKVEKPRTPLKKLNPSAVTASVFVPGQAAVQIPILGYIPVTKQVMEDSFANKSQVLVEKEKNEFSISYDEPRIQKRVNHTDFEVMKMVGEGGFGKVYQVRHIATKRIYAMKTLRKKYLVNTNNVSYTFTERNVLRRVKHPFVCQLHFAFQTRGKVYLVMDFLNGGQIFYHLKRQTMFGESEVQFYTAEITLALSHLHSLGILHRDLKPENILLDGQGHVHLTDFGLARDFGSTEDEGKTDTYCGTVEYMAPEMIQGKDYGTEVDWWSLGILLYDMLTGSPPWTDKNEKKLCDMIVNSKLLLPSYLSDDSKSVLKGLLQRDVEKRFTASDIQSHSWFTDTDWNNVFNKEISPPFVPAVPGGDTNTLNFDQKYIRRKNVAATTPSDHVEELSKSEEALFVGFSFDSRHNHFEKF